MEGTDRPLHYVCTRPEAWDLAREHDRFWVCRCGCRAGRGGCARSGVEVCLQFAAVTAANPLGLREISLDEVGDILREVEEKRLVPRPFRDYETRTRTEGICFCCDDCCGYFLNPEETCDRGAFVESTDLSGCNDCLACVEVCHFGARAADGGTLRLRRDECYGCGLCADVCPTGCVSLVPRTT
jgi:NAD-dependent dihydropyrimidine dehydrogenase PreA subunit